MPLAISSALVTGGRLENIAILEGAPGIGARTWAGHDTGRIGDAPGSAHVPHFRVEVQFDPGHAHAAVADRHAFAAQAPGLLAEALRALGEGDPAVRAQHPV